MAHAMDLILFSTAKTLKTQLIGRPRFRFQIDGIQWTNKNSTITALKTELSLKLQPTESRMEVVT